MNKFADRLKNIFTINRLIIFSIILFVFSICELVDAFAGEDIMVFNGNGECIECSEEYYETQNPVKFVFEYELKSSESVVFKESRDGGNSYDEFKKLIDNEYVVYPEDKEEYVVISFFSYDSLNNEYKPIGNDKYYIHFNANATDLFVDFKNTMYMQKDGYMYLCGESPVLYVTASDIYDTFASVTQDGKEQVIVVEGKLELSFAEGEYCVNIYTVDKAGRKVYSGESSINFVYDVTPPSNPVYYIYGDHREKKIDGINYVLSNEAITVCADITETGSGIDKLELMAGNTKGIGKVTLPASYKGVVKGFAIDNCGNESEIFECAEGFIVDSDAPVIDIAPIEAEAGIDIQIILSDKKAGLGKTDIYLGNTLLRSEEYSEQYVEERILKVGVGLKEINGESINVYSYDNVGNCSHLEYVINSDDKQPPIIEIKGCRDNGVYAGKKEIDVYVNDSNITPDNICIQTKYKGFDGKIFDADYDYGELLFFEDEGIYEIIVTAIDDYGNSSSKTVSFTIDNQAPIIKGLDKIDGNYLPKFSIKPLLSNMFEDDSFVEYRLFLNGESFDENKVVTRDGHYNLYVRAMDAAGNEAQDQAEFVVYSIDDNLEKEAVRKNKKIIINSASQNHLNESANDEKEVISDALSESKHSIQKKEYLIYSTICGVSIIAVAIGLIIMKKKEKECSEE